MSDATLSVMQPVEITDSILTSTTVAEADYAAWDSGTTYNTVGDRVIRNHRIYENAKTGNLNKDPTDINNRTGSTIWWIDVSATNAWKMFDGENSSATVNATSLTIVLTPGFVSGLFAGGLVADSATITVKDAPAGTTVYSQTITLENSQPPDYYEYFFSPFSQQPDLVIDDIPPYANCEVTFTLTISSGNVECGMFQIGDLRPLGETEWDAEAIPQTYSYIKIDEFGNNEIKRRKSARDMSLTAIVEADYANTAIDILTSVLDVPSAIIATTLDDYAGLRVFGLISGRMIYKETGKHELKIDVKGMI